MAKKKPIVVLKSFGVYSKWQLREKDLPKLVSYTDEIPAEIGIEFGYILNIKKGKNLKIQFVIEHPSILAKEGGKMPPFKGEVYIKSNDFNFFLGDSLWEPLKEKIGRWRLKTFIEEKLVYDKTLKIKVIKQAKPREVKTNF